MELALLESVRIAARAIWLADDARVRAYAAATPEAGPSCMRSTRIGCAGFLRLSQGARTDRQAKLLRPTTTIRVCAGLRCAI